MAMTLAKDDPTKLEYVWGMNYIECLNIIAYWHYRDEFIEEENKRQRLKNKIK